MLMRQRNCRMFKNKLILINWYDRTQLNKSGQFIHYILVDEKILNWFPNVVDDGGCCSSRAALTFYTFKNWRQFTAA
jgi:hypothetical protein